MNPKTDSLFTPKEFAMFFNVSLVTFYNWRKDKIIKNIVRVGGRVYVSSDEIRRIVKEGRIHTREERRSPF